MSITKKIFGYMPDESEVFIFEMDNGKNLKAEITNYGGIIKSLCVKNKDGKFVDVVLGRDTLDEYFDNPNYYGAAVGRCANRIGESKFTLGGKEYCLEANNGKNSLHGGNKGFSMLLWNVEEINNCDEPSIVLSLTSPDGDGGYPGKLDVKMTYTLTQDDGLSIHYEATTNKDTIVNLTNHSYFNLNGEGNGTVENHTMQLNCSFYTPNRKDCMPCGEILSVENTPFDFRAGKKIGQDINSDCEQIAMFGGYDHNFIINSEDCKKFATVMGDQSGIVMDVYTNKPAVQLYTDNGEKGTRMCKNGHFYKKHGAFCLETQFYPNSTSFAHFPSAVLKVGEKYDFTTEYRFSK